MDEILKNIEFITNLIDSTRDETTKNILRRFLSSYIKHTEQPQLK